MPDEIEWLPSSRRVLPRGPHLAVHRARSTCCASRRCRCARGCGWASRCCACSAAATRRRRSSARPRAAGSCARWAREAWEKVWGPLLRGKFGDRAEDISMAWLWSKLTLRRQAQGQGGARRSCSATRARSLGAAVRARCASAIEAGGGRVLIDRPAPVARERRGFEVAAGAPGSFRRGHDPRAFERGRQPERYDAVVATVPNDVFARLLDAELRDGRRRLPRAARRAIEYHTALCLLLELDRRFTPFYWTNIADPELPFVGLIEHTNLIEPERYGGRRFLYVANYLAPGDELLALDAGRAARALRARAARVNPGFDRRWVRERWLLREPAAQPIVTVGYGERIPPLQTGVPGLVLANTTQIYPEDRGTNYAVRLGDRRRRDLARELVGHAGQALRQLPQAAGGLRVGGRRARGDELRVPAQLAAAVGADVAAARDVLVAANSVGQAPCSPLWASSRLPIAIRPFWTRVAGAALQLRRGPARVRGDARGPASRPRRAGAGART